MPLVEHLAGNVEETPVERLRPQREDEDSERVTRRELGPGLRVTDLVQRTTSRAHDEVGRPLVSAGDVACGIDGGEALVVMIVAGQRKVDTTINGSSPETVDLLLRAVLGRGRPPRMMHRNGGACGRIRCQVVGQPRGFLRAVDLVAVRVEQVEPPRTDLANVVGPGVEVALIATGGFSALLMVARHRGDDVVEAAPAGRPAALELIELALVVLQVTESHHSVGFQ